MNKLGLLSLAMILLAGCTSVGPAATPTAVAVAPPTAVPATQSTKPMPTSAPATATAATAPPAATAVPTETAVPIDQSDVHCTDAEGEDDIPPAIGEAMERLGFALLPSALPEGFSLAGVSSRSNEVRQIYQNDNKNIVIAYPVEFSPEAKPDALGWTRPEDAVSGLRLGERMAYIMTGGWSDSSVICGPACEPEWDYEKSLALFFVCRVGGGRDVDVAIQALPGPIDWMSVGELVEIAQSLKRVSGP